MPNLTMLEPKTLTEAIKFSEILSKSGLVPDAYRGKPANVLVAIQWGYEVGLPPMQSLSNIESRALVYQKIFLIEVRHHNDVLIYQLNF